MARPFSEFTRIIGRGPTLSRPLDRDEAEAAMGMILDGHVAPEQLGGFLLVLRQRGETAAELAGFTAAARARMALPADGALPDIDWPSYADRHRQQPWFALAHPLGTGQPNLAIQIHGENPPALPVARKGKSGRLLRRPQQDHPAATVADYCSAVLRAP